MSAIPVNRADEHARQLLELILAMMGRLEHIVECKDPDCNLTDMEVLAGLYIRQRCRPATKSERINYHDEKDAYSTIWQSFLRMQIFPDLRYELLFYYEDSTFGRIAGELSQYYTPVSAKFEYRDNSTPWTIYPLMPAEQEAVLDFVHCFDGHFRGVANDSPFPIIVG